MGVKMFLYFDQQDVPLNLVRFGPNGGGKRLEFGREVVSPVLSTLFVRSHIDVRMPLPPLVVCTGRSVVERNRSQVFVQCDHPGVSKPPVRFAAFQPTCVWFLGTLK